MITMRWKDDGAEEARIDDEIIEMVIKIIKAK